MKGFSENKKMKRLYRVWSRDHAMLHARVEETKDEASDKTGCGNLVVKYVDGCCVSGSDTYRLLRSTAAAVSDSLFATVNPRRAS
jgi:hypothetical protein